MEEKKNYWVLEKNMQYHIQQYLDPKRSTVAFADFLDKNISINNSRILDLGAGGGANDVFLSKRYPHSYFTGIDLNEEPFKLFETYALDVKKQGHVELRKGDWYNLDSDLRESYDGVISLQTLSWLSEWKKPLEKIIEINPKWIAFSSLFYEGKINFDIKLTNYERPDVDKPYTECFYNVYSLPLIKEYMSENGYKRFCYEPYEIDIDLPKPDGFDIGTYTLKTDEGKRLQISAGLLMPWYFVFASKE